MKPNIAEIRKMIAAATPGEWSWGRKDIQADEEGDIYLGDSLTRWTINSRGNRVGNMVLRIEKNEYGQHEIVAFNLSDVALIANSRETISSLCNEVERQNAVINGMGRKIDELTMELQNNQWSRSELLKDKERQAEEIERLNKALEQIKSVTSNSEAYTDGANAHYIAYQALRRDTP